MDDDRQQLIEKIEALERRIETIERHFREGDYVRRHDLERAQLHVGRDALSGVVLTLCQVICMLVEGRFSDRREFADAMATAIKTDPDRAHVDRVLTALVMALRLSGEPTTGKEQLTFAVIEGGKSAADE